MVLTERSASVGEVRSEADFGVGEALYRKAHKEKNLPAELRFDQVGVLVCFC